MASQMLDDFFDFSRPPNVRQQRSLCTRRTRIAGGLLESARGADAGLRGQGVHERLQLLRVRHGFVVNPNPPQGDYSDRRVVPPELRPGLTKIMNSTGLSMRLMLTALAVAQTKVKAGRHFKNSMAVRGTAAQGGGWVDLVAAKSKKTVGGETSMSVNEKKERQVKNALDRLAEVGMVELGGGRGIGRYNSFGLLEEGDYAGIRRDYTVPKASERVVTLPGSFVTNGWMHLLEDSEIALLFMLSAGVGSVETWPTVAIPADDRNTIYGIGRETFESHRMLAWLGLISVSEVGRHDDGRAVDYADDTKADLHRLTLRLEGFDKSAFDEVPATITRQLKRVGK